MDLFKNAIIFSSLLLVFSCSSDLADITNQKWKCDNRKKIQNACTVSFTITNKSHLPIKSKIRMRAHNRKSVMGSDAVQNIVVGDKTLELVINPGQGLNIEESLEAKGRVTSIFVTSTSHEQ